LPIDLFGGQGRPLQQGLSGGLLARGQWSEKTDLDRISGPVDQMGAGDEQERGDEKEGQKRNR
jgi:hypothetical protein